MATETVNGWADLLLAKLAEKAKAYRLANITERMNGSVGTTTAIALNASNDVFRRKLEKVQNNDPAVTWVFTKEANDAGDLVIKAQAPVDRGGHLKVWGIVNGENGNVKRSADAGYETGNSLNDTDRDAFFAKLDHLGNFW